MRESAALAHKPAGMTFEEAAAVCDGVIIALACLRKADLQRGQSILIYGASGAIGTAAVQLGQRRVRSLASVLSAVHSWSVSVAWGNQPLR